MIFKHSTITMKTSFFLKTTFCIAAFFCVQKLSASTISSTAAGGNWNSGATWVGGIVPTSTDDVIIVAGSSVSIRNPYTVSSPAECNSLTVNGTLTLGDGAGSGAKYLSVLSSIQINSGGILQNDMFEIHYVLVGGDFVNNGTFNSLSGSGSLQISFIGSGSQLLDGGSNQTFYSFVVNKPSGSLSVSSNVTSLSMSTFTLTAGGFVSGASTTVTDSFVLSAGTFSPGGDLNIASKFINNGASFVGTTGTTTFNGVSQTIEGTMSSTFNNITIAAGSSTLIRTATVLNGNLTIADGGILSTQNGLVVNGATTIGGGSSGQFKIMSTAGNKTFVGLVKVSSGAIWDNSIVGGNVHFRGGLTNQGTYKDGTTGVNYFETNSQTLTGTFVMTNVDVNPGGISVTSKGTVTVTNDISGSGTWVQGPNSVFNLGGTYNIPVDASAIGNTVNFTAGDQTTFAIDYYNLGLSGTGTKTLRTLTTAINGNLSISGSVSTTTVVALTIGGNLSLSGSSNFSAINTTTVNGNVSIGDGCTLTTENNFTVNGTTTIGGGTSGVLNITNTTGAKTFKGLLTIANGAMWNNSVDEDIHFQGGISNQGTFVAGISSNYFDVNSQSLNGVITIPYLDVTTGVTLTNKGTLNATNNLTGAGAFVQSNNAILNLGGASTINLIDASTNINTVNYNGGAQTIFDTNYVNLNLVGSDATHVKTFQTITSSISGNFTLTGTTSAVLASAISVGGNLSIDANCSVTNGVSLSVAGSLSGGGSLTQAANSILNINGASTLGSINGFASNNTVNYNAAAPTIIPGTYFNLYLNQSSGVATLGGTVLASGVLTLNSGSLDLKDNNLTLDVAGSIVDASPSATKMLVISGLGEVRKNFSSIGSFTFPIGDASGTSEFSPITVNLTAASGFASGYIAASVSNTKNSSNKSTSDFLKRYWKISMAGISGCVADVSATYLMADVNGTESNIAAGQLDGTFDQLTNGWKKSAAIGSNLLTVTGASLTDGNTSIFTGITATNPTVNITGGNGPAVCVGTQVQLGSTVTGTPTFAYLWSPASGLSSKTIANPKAKPGSTTVYTLTVYDGNGITASNSTTITTQQPTVSVNTLAFCNGGSGDLTASGASSYVWSPATGLSATTGSTVTANPTVTTTYKVIGTDLNSCTDTVTTKVTIYPIPTKPTITVSNQFTPTPKLTASSATTYQWFDDGVAIPGATAKTLTVTADGSYTVQVTSSYGCLSDISDPTVIAILAVEGQAGSLRIYPNPTSDFVKIDMGQFDVNGSPIEVQLYDMLGRTEFTKIISRSDNSVDVRSLSKGTYVVMARQDNRLVVEKLIKN